jgi:hypothetical protein
MKTRIATQFRQVFQAKPRRETAARYLVLYDGSLASVLALREACESAPNGTRVVAVYLEQVPHSEPLPEAGSERSMNAKAILASALANARMWNVAIETQSVPCHVAGPAFAALAQTYANVTLFVGVDKKALSEHSNSFVDFLLASARARVVVVEV